MPFHSKHFPNSLFFMSNYDPFHIYTKRSKSTQKGQVLRKKIPNYIGYCFTDEELERAIAGLEARGYHIFKPGVNPQQPVQKRLEHSFLYTNIDLGSLQYQDQTVYNYKFSNLWPIIVGDFYDILAIDNLRVQTCNFYISLVGFTFGGSITSSTQNATFNIGVSVTTPLNYNNIAYNIVTRFTADHSLLLSCQSFNRQSILIGEHATQSSTNGLRISNHPIGGLPVPYLNYTNIQQIAILTALRNQDFTVFDPLIASWRSETPADNVTIEHHQFSILVSLAIDYT